MAAATGPKEGSARRVVPAVVGAFVAGTFAVVLAQQLGTAAPICGPGGELMRLGRGPAACIHQDQAPPGVDVTTPVATSELRSRVGAGPAAYEAAEDLGVATAYASTATTPDVTCDGDGTSGYRVQPMYVVEATKANRYSALLPSLRLWAAGTDDVVNRSAALSGGVRHLRYMTEPGGGGCVAKVLNVTVPAGSMTSFGATVTAVQNLGYNNPARKYLMWTDASVLCGVASVYPVDTDGQANPNNGSYPQYARIDSGCWGLGDGAGQHSVEAHEITHTLGSVFASAPHGTTNGHCWDESDTMCYADGGGHSMVQVCTPDREYLLDCNSDDYFSTYPDPGSYLDTHWNSADNRFLIGGGDGSGGGTAGSPSVLGASIAVNNPAVPGLSTQVSVSPAVPDGRAISSVQWTSARADCKFATPTELQSTVTCAASTVTTTTVTVRVTDSTGATKTVSSPLTFATGTARPVTLSLSVASQDSATTPTASVCTGAAFPVTATLVDTQTGQPIKGLPATFTRKTATMTAPYTAGTVVSSPAGLSTVNQSAVVATTYTARTPATNVYAAAAQLTQAAAPATCAPALTAGAGASAIYYGDPVVVSGTLTRVTGGVTVPVSGAYLPVRLTDAATLRVTTLGTARTAADGSYRLVTKPTATGTIGVSLTGSAAYTAATVSAGSVSVAIPATLLTGAVNRTDVGYGGTVVVTGILTRDAGGTVTPLASRYVSVKVTVPGKSPVVVATGRTLADGSYTIGVPLRLSGLLWVAYSGAAGQPAKALDLATVTAGTWTPTLTASMASPNVPPGGYTTLSGTLARSYGGLTEPARSVRLKVYFLATGATSPTLVNYATTTTMGTYTVRVYPKVSGTYRIALSVVAGYANTESGALGVTVS